MNLGNRFRLGCNTIIFVGAGSYLYNVLSARNGFAQGGAGFMVPIAVAIFAAFGIVTTIEAIRREESDALGNDQWLVILGSFLLTAGASLFALGGLCSMIGVNENSMMLSGAGMLVVAGLLAYWRRHRRRDR